MTFCSRAHMVTFMTRLLLCLVIALCLSAPAQSGKKSSGELEIAALEHSWAAAQKANDVTTIASLLADAYMEVLPDGSLMNAEGDEVALHAPGGTESLTILEVRYERIAVEPFREPPSSEASTKFPRQR
jgi:hypothetical protein